MFDEKSAVLNVLHRLKVELPNASPERRTWITERLEEAACFINLKHEEDAVALVGQLAVTFSRLAMQDYSEDNVSRASASIMSI